MAVLALVLTSILLGLVPSAIALFASRHVPDGIRPEDLGIESYEHVTFDSVDTVLGRPITVAGVHFDGTHTPTGCDAVTAAERRDSNRGVEIVVVHGHGSAALREEGGCSPMRFAVKPLLCAGFNVLAIDMRNHGHSSDAPPMSLGWHEAQDVLSAVDWLATQRNASKSRIFLWGMSMGAATVGYAAAQDPGIRAVAMEAPPVSMGMVLASWLSQVMPLPHGVVDWLAWWTAFVYVDRAFGQDMLHEARFVHADVFHSHGYDDQVVPFPNALALGAALRRRRTAEGTPSYEEFFHHGGHVSSWRLPEAYYPRLLRFFAAAAARSQEPEAGGLKEAVQRLPAKASLRGSVVESDALTVEGTKVSSIR